MEARHLLISFMIFIFMPVGSIVGADECSRAGDLYNQAAGERNHLDRVMLYQKARKWRPDFSEAWNNLADAEDHLGRTDQVIAHYRKALTMNPDLARAHFILGYHPING